MPHGTPHPDLNADFRRYRHDRHSEREDDTFDVVVVGAGVGGLRTAVELQQRSSDAGRATTIKIFEARSRVGGRLLSEPVAGGCVDLGATWFWANEHRINRLIASSALRSFAQFIEGDMMFENNGVRRLEGNQLGQPSGRVAGGMQVVATALFDQLPAGTVAFEQVVRSIRSSDGGLVVMTNGGSFTAQHVVLAIPPALAMASIDFGPELPADVRNLAASTPVWMGTMAKVVAVFDRPFWRDSGLAGSAFSYDGPLREIYDMSGPNGDPAALFGFCPGGSSATAPTRDAVVAQLAGLFGPLAGSPLALHIMDWQAEPFTSPPRAAELTNFDLFGHQLYQTPTLDGRLHWASTETSTVAPGHIEGALAAGDRAAAAIATALGLSESTLPRVLYAFFRQYGLDRHSDGAKGPPHHRGGDQLGDGPNRKRCPHPAHAGERSSEQSAHDDHASRKDPRRDVHPAQ